MDLISAFVGPIHQPQYHTLAPRKYAIFIKLKSFCEKLNKNMRVSQLLSWNIFLCGTSALYIPESYQEDLAIFLFAKILDFEVYLMWILLLCLQRLWGIFTFGRYFFFVCKDCEVYLPFVDTSCLFAKIVRYIYLW